MKKIKDWFRSFLLVYIREFRLIIHDGGLILFFTFLPLVYPIIYSLIYNPELVRDVPVVVVDHDRSSRSREMVRKLDACQEVWIKGYAADLNEARRAMDGHDCYGILEIPEGFARKIGNSEQADAVMYSDMSLLLRYRGFLVATTNVMADMGAGIQMEKIDELAPLAATISDGDILPMHNVSMGNLEGGFDSFIMPGVVILILHQCLVLAVGMAGGAKREKASMIGYNPLDGVKSTLASLLGQMLCFITIILLPTIFLAHYVPMIFSFPMAGDFFEEFLFLMPMIIACVALGMCFQAVVWERESVFMLWVATSVAFLFLSGITWPRYAMPEAWKWLSDIIPGTWGVQGFIQMNTNGASLSQVGGFYRNLWILAGVYTVLAYVLQRYVVRPSVERRLRQFMAANKNVTLSEEL